MELVPELALQDVRIVGRDPFMQLVVAKPYRPKCLRHLAPGGISGGSPLI